MVWLARVRRGSAEDVGDGDMMMLWDGGGYQVGG